MTETGHPLILSYFPVFGRAFAGGRFSVPVVSAGAKLARFKSDTSANVTGDFNSIASRC
jgi:hypothetical protein